MLFFMLPPSFIELEPRRLGKAANVGIYLNWNLPRTPFLYSGGMPTICSRYLIQCNEYSNYISYCILIVKIKG